MQGIMEYALFFVLPFGLFILVYCLAMLASARNQLHKSINYRVLRVRADKGISKWLALSSLHSKQPVWKKGIIHLIQKWEMWSEIGSGKSLSLSLLLVKSIAISILFSFMGRWLTSDMLVSVISFLVGGALPLIVLRGRFAQVAYRARRKGLLPFVDIYKNAYVQANENVITAFHLSEPDCPKAMRPILEWLLRRLHNGSLQKNGLREFANILRSEWAHVFVNYLISGLEGEAKNITRALAQLQIEMHSTRDEEEDREVITTGAFYSNFVIIGLTLLGIIFLASILPLMSRFFFQSDEGHVLLTLSFLAWIIMVSYSYFQMKGGNL